MITGHVLWLDYGKGKEVVTNFINHVGIEWMEHVEAVSCDMNATYYKAFEENCPWIQSVFDYFHIKKNFNDKVVSEIRKDEQRRLAEEGDLEAARKLKHTRWILTSNPQTLMDKDLKAGIDPQEGSLARYESLVSENKLLFTVDLVREKLDNAYNMRNEAEMAAEIIEIMDLCHASGNEHLLWFEKLLDNHFEGIIAHAYYNISNARLEGFNNRIKTVRRQAYGYHDDHYFFLKLFDASRQKYVRNPKSHKVLQ